MKEDISSRFKLHFISDGPLLEQAQLLRSRVFFGKDMRDKDRFDKFCRHIVVTDAYNANVVGTYRLLLGSVASGACGFYSETEFDLTNIKKHCKGEVLEMGRACVDDAYRKYPIINMMWNKIISYLEEKDIKYIIGCSSVEEPTGHKIGELLSFFKSRCACPGQFKAHPLDGKAYPYEPDVHFDDLSIRRKVPSLIKGYIKMGAYVCGEPVWDKEFDTADFFMLLEVEKMNRFFRKKFYDKDN